jgi:hypothetical protein
LPRLLLPGLQLLLRLLLLRLQLLLRLLFLLLLQRPLLPGEFTGGRLLLMKSFRFIFTDELDIFDKCFGSALTYPDPDPAF